MFETWLETDSGKLARVTKLRGRTFSQDEDANKIGVIVNGVSALSGDVKGYVIRPDGTMVNDITGSKSGNMAWIVLPDDAYTQTGMITVTLKVVDGETITTLGAVEAYVYKSC